MFPVSDVIPSRTRPVVTVALIVLMAVAFTYELLLDERELLPLVHRRGVVPTSLNGFSVLTAMFLHAGWLHAGANMLFLWLFGGNVEDRLGRGRYVLFYLGCGCASALAHVAINPDSGTPIVGASGALAGVMGAYLVLYPQSRVLTAVFAIVFFDVVELPAIFYVGLWCVAQLFIDAGSIGVETGNGGAMWLSNGCGFVAGALGGVYLRFREQTLRAYWSVNGSQRG